MTCTVEQIIGYAPELKEIHQNRNLIHFCVVSLCEKGKNSLKNQLVFEKSPTYYKNRAVPARLHDFDPDMKIILVVCNNVRRMLSR